MTWIEPKCLVEVLYRTLVLPQGAVRNAPIVVGIGVLLVEAEGRGWGLAVHM